jgi:hypothetical protein
MNVFSKRNALVGFLTLKALQRRRQRKRSAGKLAALVILGLLSAGVLAAVAAVVVRRQREGQESQHLEGYAVADEIDVAEAVGPTELAAETSEPGAGFAA